MNSRLESEYCISTPRRGFQFGGRFRWACRAAAADTAVRIVRLVTVTKRRYSAPGFARNLRPGLIRGRLFNRVDDVILYGTLLRLQLQSELLLHSVEQVWPVEESRRQIRRSVLAIEIRRQFRQKRQLEIVIAVQAGLIDHRPAVLLKLLPQPPGEVLHWNPRPGEAVWTAVDRNLKRLWGRVGLHLQPGFIDHERVHGAFFALLVELQLELVGQHVLIHDV